MTVISPSLLRDKAYIDGTWQNGSKSFTVINPATGAEIGRVPDLGAEEARAAIKAAEQAFPDWSKRTAKDRASILRNWYDLIVTHQEELARLMTEEQGKPLTESRGEVLYGASFVEWYAEEAKRIYGDVIPTHSADKRIVTVKQPIGVVAAITPWNFPNAMITRKCAPALAAGCTVVIKPAEDTPLSALALAELAARAGFPSGVFNVITAKDPVEVGTELTANPSVRKLSFTGSTAVGKHLMRQCADTVKKVSLELGGNAPFIVFDDADIDAAVAGSIASKFRNAGQTCVCANRILVQEGVYDDFIEKFKAAMAALKQGNGLDDGVTQGPLINEQGLAKVEHLVSSAEASGAIIDRANQGPDLGGGGTFYPPTLLTNVTLDMEIANEEIFGPVAPVYRFKDEKEAIAIANDTPYGLAAYFYARDLGRVWRVLEALEFGIVGVNEGITATEVAPFGGVKESGIGREGSKYGIEEFLEIKYICMGGID